MKKIWNDPVWSKVISAIILAIPAFLISVAINFWNNRKFPIDWTGFTVQVNGIILCTVLLFLVFVGISILYHNTFFKYDVFISAPMSFSDDVEYQKFRAFCLEIKALLESECGYQRIYYAGSEIESIKQFSAHQHAAENDIKALRSSKCFLLIMPQKMQSSAIFEAGFAFRKCIPSVFFCKNIGDLPFLMKHLNDSFRFVKVYTPDSGDMDELKTYIKKHKRQIFSIKKE